MYHLSANNSTTDILSINEGTGTATAKALAILFMPPAMQLFMPMQQKSNRLNRRDTEHVSYKTAISNPIVNVMESSAERVAVLEDNEETEVTNENAGSIKAMGMMHHLRHTKN